MSVWVSSSSSDTNTDTKTDCQELPIIEPKEQKQLFYPPGDNNESCEFIFIISLCNMQKKTQW